MALVFRKEGLEDFQIPFIAQTFIPHNAVLYKIYVVGDKYFIFARPSLKNFVAGGKFCCILVWYSNYAF